MTSGLKFVDGHPASFSRGMDIYFSADVETDGSIPGEFSMLSLALVYAGAYDGETFYKPTEYTRSFYCELKPISSNFEIEALQVNGLDRDLYQGALRLTHAGDSQAAENLIRHGRHVEACDGGSDWGSI